MEILLTPKGQNALIELIVSGSSDFKARVSKAWSTLGQRIVRNIVIQQLSGRRGNMYLNRRSGNAARALNTTTNQSGGDVVQRFFLSSSNPASRYLPVHDKSWLGNRRIVPTRKRFLVWQENGKWRHAKSVFIPARTHIVETIVKEGTAGRWNTLTEILSSLMKTKKS
jgi:hypothetical protein